MPDDHPAWLASLRATHRNKLTFNFSRPGDVPTLSVSPRQGSSTDEISLDGVDEERLTLDLTGMTTCSLSDAAAGLTLHAVGGRSHQPLQLTLTASVQGRVELEAGRRTLAVEVEGGSPVELAIVDGGVRPCGESLDHPIELAGGWLHSGTYEHVVMRGGTPWNATEQTKLAVGVLELLDDAVLEVGAGITCTVARLCTQSGQRSLHLIATPNPRGNSNNSNFTIEVIESVKLVADNTTTVTVRGPLRGSVFAGSVGVIVPQGVALDGPVFEHHDGKAPRLRAAPQSVVRGIKGTVVIQAASGASLTGAGDGFHIAKVESKKSGFPQTDYFTNAYLRNFIVDPGLQGHALLSYMDDAHQVEPSTADLPGWDLRFKLTSSASKVDRRNAEFMRKLSELADTKGASGSVRTKIGWCTQRLRHEATTGWVERRALDGYRCLGYGERPGPPLMTWLVLSLVFTLLLWWLGHALVGNLGDFLALWANRAASPVGAILGTGTAAEDSAWLYLIRAIVATPLVIAALCVRKYVRAGK